VISRRTSGEADLSLTAESAETLVEAPGDEDFPANDGYGPAISIAQALSFFGMQTRFPAPQRDKPLEKASYAACVLPSGIRRAAPRPASRAARQGRRTSVKFRWKGGGRKI
jgi:hypothetical protein